MAPEVFEMGIPLMDFDADIPPERLVEIKRIYQFFKKKGRIKGEEPNWNDLITTKYLEKAKAIRK